MSVMHYRQWPTQTVAQNRFKQIFGQLLENTEADESSVVTSEWVPQVDIKEEGNRFVIYADLAGVNPADIEVNMEKGILSIKGERQSETTAENESFSRVERRYGSFHRRFALPESADPDHITATGDNGVLMISIPKKPETTPRRIQVNSGNK